MEPRKEASVSRLGSSQTGFFVRTVHDDFCRDNHFSGRPNDFYHRINES